MKLRWGILGYGRIAKVFEEVGRDGVVTVEESQTFGLEKEIVEGMQFDKGYISSFFAGNQFNHADHLMLGSDLQHLC